MTCLGVVYMDDVEGAFLLAFLIGGSALALWLLVCLLAYVADRVSDRAGAWWENRQVIQGKMTVRKWLRNKGFLYRHDFDDYVYYRNFEVLVAIANDAVKDADAGNKTMRQWIIDSVNEKLA